MNNFSHSVNEPQRPLTPKKVELHPKEEGASACQRKRREGGRDRKEGGRELAWYRPHLHLTSSSPPKSKSTALEHLSERWRIRIGIRPPSVPSLFVLQESDGQVGLAKSESEWAALDKKHICGKDFLAGIKENQPLFPEWLVLTVSKCWFHCFSKFENGIFHYNYRRDQRSQVLLMPERLQLTY